MARRKTSAAEQEGQLLRPCMRESVIRRHSINFARSNVISANFLWTFRRILRLSFLRGWFRSPRRWLLLLPRISYFTGRRARARCTHASQSQKAETCFCTLYLSLVPRMHSRFQRTHLSGLFNFMRRFVLRALCRRPSWKRLGDDAITFHDRDDYKNVECREQRDSRAHCPFKGRKNRNSTKMKKHARTTLLWTRLQCILIFSSIIYYWSSAIKKFCSYISTLVRQPTCEVTLKNVNAVHNFALGEIYKGYTKSGYFLRSPTA